MTSELLAEMKAKRDERLPMTLDRDQLVEVLNSLPGESEEAAPVEVEQAEESPAEPKAAKKRAKK